MVYEIAGSNNLHDKNIDMISFKIGILVLLLTLQIETLDNGLALLPPLVFSTFQLGCNYDENVLRGQVDQAAVSGLLSKGFKYMVLEDCWQGQRNTVSGKITPSLNKFPSGLPNFIAYANSKGMKVGLGTDIGSKTRSEKPGSFGYQKIDALTYAEWGIEWVSIWNSQNLSGVRARFTQMSEYLQESGRKVLISINNNHKDNVQVWGSSVANCWDSSSAQTASDWQALGKTFLSQVGHQAYSGSGSWNDAGFLSSRLPISEFLVQLVGWIGLKSPLKISVPLASFDNSKLSLILKDQLLEISQDSLKKQAKLLRHEQFERGWQQVWGGPLSGNRYVLIFVNGMSSVSQMSASLSKEAKISNFVSYWIRDPVTGTTLGSSSNDVVSANKVGSHSAEVRVLHS